jgi:hypothetical protein
MLLGDFFQQLSYGELSNLSISGEGSGEIIESERNKLVSSINGALMVLNQRLSYKKGYVKFATNGTQHLYRLEPGAGFLTEPLDERLHKIVAVNRLDDHTTPYHSEAADVLLNARNTQEHTPVATILGSDSLHFKTPRDGEQFVAEVRFVPRKLSLPADLAEEIDLPPLLEPLLETLVAARVYSGMNGELTLGKSQMYLSQFEQSVALITAEDLMAETETDERDRLREAGFV